MKLRKAAFAALLGALYCMAASAAQKPKAIDLWLSADITIDETGHITALDWVETQPGRKLVASRIAPRVQGWEFVPATIDGKPSEARTGLFVGTRLIERDDGSMDIQVTHAGTGPRTVAATPPSYPQNAFTSGVEAIVTVDFDVDAEGKPVITDMAFDGSSGKTGKRSYRDAFLEATRLTVQGWRFKPEVVAGHAMPTHMHVPVDYCLDDTGSWCKTHPSATQLSERPANMPLALNSAVAFKTDFRAGNIP